MMPIMTSYGGVSEDMVKICSILADAYQRNAEEEGPRADRLTPRMLRNSYLGRLKMALMLACAKGKARIHTNAGQKHFHHKQHTWRSTQ